MRHPLMIAVALLAGHSATAAAQGVNLNRSMALGSALGSWDTKTMVGPKDSVVATAVFVATTDEEAWTLTFSNPKTKPIPLRILLAAFDSVITEAGPYPSVLRPGQTVTRLQMTTHFNGDKMTGTFEAHYDKGDVVRGKLAGTRKKK